MRPLLILTVAFIVAVLVAMLIGAMALVWFAEVSRAWRSLP